MHNAKILKLTFFLIAQTILSNQTVIQILIINVAE